MGFAVEPNGNRKGFTSIEDWYKDQIRNWTRSMPKADTITINGRPAIRIEGTLFGKVSYHIITLFNEKDLFHINYNRPLTDSDQKMYDQILSTFKFKGG